MCVYWKKWQAQRQGWHIDEFSAGWIVVDQGTTTLSQLNHAGNVAFLTFFVLQTLSSCVAIVSGQIWWLVKIPNVTSMKLNRKPVGQIWRMSKIMSLLDRTTQSVWSGFSYCSLQTYLLLWQNPSTSIFWNTNLCLSFGYCSCQSLIWHMYSLIGCFFYSRSITVLGVALGAATQCSQ